MRACFTSDGYRPQVGRGAYQIRVRLLFCRTAASGRTAEGVLQMVKAIGVYWLRSLFDRPREDGTIRCVDSSNTRNLQIKS